MRVKVTVLECDANASLSVWGSDGGSATLTKGQSAEVFGVAVSMSGNDSSGVNQVAGPGFPNVGSAGGND